MNVQVDVLAVLDAYSVPGQICCGMPMGGGCDENGNMEPPSCCGVPFTECDMQATRAAVAALIAERDALRDKVGEQPAPVDLEEFREAVECWGSHRRSGRGDPRVAAEADRLLALIDNAGKVGVHPDDAAVDRFAVAMKAKLADARAKGRGGWQGDEPGMQQRLSDMLRTHVEKGDPRDVANFAMFLHQRYESILPAHQPALVLDDELPGMWSQSDFMGGATDAADNAHRPVPAVDDAMVERALNVQPLAGSNNPARLWQLLGMTCGESPSDVMRAALTAALARSQEVQS